MRLLVLVLCLPLSACDFAASRVDHAVVLEVRVEALDLERPWDSPLTGDRPDIYVDVKRPTGRIAGLQPLWRSSVVDNVERLPLSFRPDAEVRLALADSTRINVSDRDGVGDDQMFTTGTLRLAERYAGQAAGTVGRLVFESDQGRIAVSVRWD